MIKLNDPFILTFAVLLLISCNKNHEDIEENAKNISQDTLLTSAPFIKLNHTADFKSGNHWKEASGFYYSIEKADEFTMVEGEGILVSDTKGVGSPIVTNFDHGDIEISLNFILSKGSNITFSFLNNYNYSIVEKSVAEDTLNYLKAPGLWQTFNATFKISQGGVSDRVAGSTAFLENVKINDFLIADRLVLSPVSGKEKTKGSFSITGKGPIAIKDFGYKLYGDKKVIAKAITYRYFEGDWAKPYSKLPDFEKLEKPVKEGKAKSFNIEDIGVRNGNFACEFTSKIEIPIDGLYYFSLISSDGSKLFIDDKQIVDNDGLHGLEKKTGSVQLKKGTHDLRIGAFKKWGKITFAVFVEGPNMQYSSLASPSIEGKGDPKGVVLIDPVDKPRMQRGFIRQKDSVRTTAISVGFPEKLNYSYDTHNGSLIYLWKGDFADVSRMWHGRGAAQSLLPRGMYFSLPNGYQIAALENIHRPWPSKSAATFLGYHLDKSFVPIYDYSFGVHEITDEIKPSKNGFERILKINGDSYDDVFIRLAVADDIKDLGKGLYRVDGNYYIKTDNKHPIIRKSEGKTELLLNLYSTVKYSWIW